MHKIGDLLTYLVKVLTPAEKVNGTGFFCLPEGYILTCYHVIAPWLSTPDEIKVVHLAQVLNTTLRLDFSQKDDDLAVLQVKASEKREDWPYLPLDTYWRVELGDRLQSFGFPQGKKWLGEGGISISAEVGGLTLSTFEEVDVYPITGLNVSNVDGGYSGAPLINQITQKVIGLIHAKYRTQPGVHGTLGFPFRAMAGAQGLP